MRPDTTTIIIIVIALIAVLLFPSRQYEIYVGENMRYDTELAKDIDRQLKILKVQLEQLEEYKD